MKTYLQLHMPTHGIGYFKNILAAFATKQSNLPNKQDNKTLSESIDQWKMNEVDFTQHKIPFDRVVYFYAPQELFSELSTFRRDPVESIQHDKQVPDDIQKIWEKLIEIYKSKYNHTKNEAGETIEPKEEKPESGLLQTELNFVLENYGEGKKQAFQKLLWRYIHYYPVLDQIEWFKTMAGLPIELLDKIEFVDLTNKEFGLINLRDYENFSESVRNWLLKPSNKKIQSLYLNISLVGYVLPTVMFVLAEANFLPANTYFLTSFDNKNDNTHDRFKNFTIGQERIHIIKTIGQSLKISESKTPARRLAGLLLENYLSRPSGFTILLLGERGIGKTRLANDSVENIKKTKDDIVYANCAAFDDDSKAESELFGYVKGAFTGADKDKDGFFQAANGKILFLDEVHHLSKFVQAKLMASLQTDKDGYFLVRKMGSTSKEKIKCNVILASNKTIDELRIGAKALLSDFYDRITQHIIELPPLRETIDDRKSDWEAVWDHMKFKSQNAKSDEKLINWLIGLPLPGNFRDLEKIAIAYFSFENFSDDIKNLLDPKTPFEYAKAQYEKYHGVFDEAQRLKFSVDFGKNPYELETEFHAYIANELERIYGSMDKVVAHFGKNESGKDVITSKTLYNWKNRK